MINPTPTKEGYFWAKLKTPSYGSYKNESWESVDWEIVSVVDNNGEPGTEEEFYVSVFGVPEVQWREDFFWGEEVEIGNDPRSES